MKKCYCSQVTLRTVTKKSLSEKKVAFSFVVSNRGVPEKEWIGIVKTFGYNGSDKI